MVEVEDDTADAGSLARDEPQIPAVKRTVGGSNSVNLSVLDSRHDAVARFPGTITSWLEPVIFGVLSAAFRHDAGDL